MHHLNSSNFVKTVQSVLPHNRTYLDRPTSIPGFWTKQQRNQTPSMCVATPHTKAESPQEVNCAWENTRKCRGPPRATNWTHTIAQKWTMNSLKHLERTALLKSNLTWYLNAPLIFRRSILTVTDYEITCLCLAGLVPSCAPNFEPRPRASSQWEGSNPLILTKFREQGLFPMLGTTKSNLFTFVVWILFTNSVEQFVFICSEKIQLCDSPEQINLLQLFGGTLQCSGGEAMSPTLQLTCHICCTLTSRPNTAILYNATLNSALNKLKVRLSIRRTHRWVCLSASSTDRAGNGKCREEKSRVRLG